MKQWACFISSSLIQFAIICLELCFIFQLNPGTDDKLVNRNLNHEKVGLFYFLRLNKICYYFFLELCYIFKINPGTDGKPQKPFPSVTNKPSFLKEGKTDVFCPYTFLLWQAFLSFAEMICLLNVLDFFRAFELLSSCKWNGYCISFLVLCKINLKQFFL